MSIMHVELWKAYTFKTRATRRSTELRTLDAAIQSYNEMFMEVVQAQKNDP